MADFPSALSALTNPDGADLLDAPDHATQHSNANDEIEALQAKVGIDSSAVTTSHDYKLSGVTGSDLAVSKTGTETLTNKTITSPSGLVKADVGLGNVDNTSDITLMGTIYPVGAIYISTLSTNPNTLLGFGTWTAFGAGRVLVGLDSGDTDFDASEETGGAKTVAGDPHSHTLSDAGQAAIVQGASVTKSRRVAVAGTWTETHTATLTSTGASGTNTLGSALLGATDEESPAATSVVQPYITVYMWKRTA